TTVHLAAPGKRIISCFEGWNDRYEPADGTSMSAPHVAGACALVWAHFSSLTYRQVINRVLASTDYSIYSSSLVGKCVTSGRLNLYQALMIAAGSRDPSFIPGNGADNNTINAIARQSDGKVLIGGTFTTVNGAAKSYLARLKFDGSVDAGFSTTINGSVSAIAVQSDGLILVGGSFTLPKARLARLNTDGTLDHSSY